MFQLLNSISQNTKTVILTLLGLVISITVSFFTFLNPIIPIFIIVLIFALGYVVATYKSPMFGLMVLIGYCFTFVIFSREIGSSIPFGIGIEIFLLLVWIVVFIKNQAYNWGNLNNILIKLMFIWFIISALEVVNPAGASVRGWLQEIRSTGLFPILIIPLIFLLFDDEKKMDTILIFMILLSVLATFNGIKQLHYGLTPGEQRFLIEGGAKTHILWGKLRVFSFYSDSGQFGASQASFFLLALSLALGPFKKWKKFVLFFIAGLTFYGMLISGTRGAFFALIVGGFFIIFLTKNVKVLIIGVCVVALFIGFLKFTTIGNGNYEIYRLRSAVDPKEASLNVRMDNQKILAEYLKSRPFGGGLGVIGAWGKEYNADKFLSTIEPDSYWVKIWAMYGIVGFTLWFCMMMFLLGKCCAIIWKIKNTKLRYKNIAMISATAGLFFCSYGNEVMNSMPSAVVSSVSLAFIFLSQKFDKDNLQNLESDKINKDNYAI